MIDLPDALVKIGHCTLRCKYCGTIYDTSGVDIEDQIPPIGDGCEYCDPEIEDDEDA